MKVNIDKLEKILREQTNLDIKLIQCHKNLICIDTNIVYPNGDFCSIHIQRIDEITVRIIDDSNCVIKKLPLGFKIHDNKIYMDTPIETLGSSLLKFVGFISN
ncbi:hypothetical protein KY334_02595 [Candidatus Woesearchaeota archaeon]|nr:hypothetical protein [Candidatus Woesearchaeota archaeon]